MYTPVPYIAKSASASFTRDTSTAGLGNSYLPAACMPKITPSNNPIVAVDPNPMGMVCVHSSASLGLKSTAYPALYFSFLFTHAFSCYEAMRWQDILGAVGLLARLLGAAALNWIPTWSEESEYWVDCVFNTCSPLIWSNTHSTSWESEQVGNKRELVGLFLEHINQKYMWWTRQYLRTLSRTLIDSPRATRSDHRVTVETP